MLFSVGRSSGSFIGFSTGDPYPGGNSGDYYNQFKGFEERQSAGYSQGNGIQPTDDQLSRGRRSDSDFKPKTWEMDTYKHRINDMMGPEKGAVINTIMPGALEEYTFPTYSEVFSHLNGNQTLDRTDPPDVNLPKEMLFNDDSLVSVVAYSVLFVIAAVGNMTVFLTLFRNRHRKSRVNLFIMHLSIADLIVTFIMLPIEIGWHLTVSWKAGEVGCRLFMFLRAFGFYLSSFVLIAISLDRYFAILHPLSLTDAGKRGKIMLTFAWGFSVIASAPQSAIFHQEEHPGHPWFKQCVTFNFFPTPAHELAYNLFNAITVYGLPLVVIIIAYGLILWEMSKKTRESRDQSSRSSPSTLRRSGIGRIERAKTRTLKMTVVIVLVFIMCWTPYYVISAWWWFDRESASKLDNKIQRGLFIFAVSNSCMDPIVYGFFAIDFVREFKRCCCFWKRHNYYRARPSNSSKCQEPAHRCFLPGDSGGERSSPQTRTVGIVATKALNGSGYRIQNVPSQFLSTNKNSLERKSTPPHIAGTRETCIAMTKSEL